MVSKKIVQDIVSSKRRSIREVNLSEGPEEKNPQNTAYAGISREDIGIRVPLHLDHTGQEKRDFPAPSASVPAAPQEPAIDGPRPPQNPKKSASGRNWKWIIGGVVIISCIAIVYAISVFMARAHVIITLQSEDVPINGTFTAVQNAESPDLSFETISTTTIAHTSVQATLGGTVSTYATAMAVLINAASPSPQKIIAGTRLEDGRGLVYKTVSTVVIPAASSKSIGTVGVKIIASAPGPAYDLSLSSLKGDLTIVAWQGTAKASIFYSHMTTDATGGSSGPKMIVPSAALNAVTATLSSNLMSAAQNALVGMVPSGYILYPKAASIALSSTTIGSIAQSSSASSSVADASMQAIATGIIFKETDLENTLAKSEIARFPADDYTINGLSSLVFTPTAGQALSSSAKSIEFALSGDLSIDGALDPDKIKAQLEGKPLSTSNSIFNQYSSVISSAQISIVPFWIHTIPSSSAHISVAVSTSTETK